MPTIRPSKFATVARFVGYAALCIGGVFLIFTLPLYTQDGVYVLFSYWLAIGGGLSALGTLTDRWAGEFVGLPLLFSAMGAFAGFSAKEAYQMHQLEHTMGNILLLVGFAALFLARWRDVVAVYRAAARQARA